MEVKLTDIHSPCLECFRKDIYYDPASDRCQRCEYNIAIKLLKRVLKENDYCTLCKNRKRLGGGYWDCTDEKASFYGGCVADESFAIDWETACQEYGIKFTK